MTEETASSKCGLESGKLFLIYATDAGVIKELEEGRKGAGMIVADCALARHIGISFDISGFSYTQKHLFTSICNGNDKNEKRRKSGKVGGVKSGEVRKHQADCRAFVFKDRDDMLGALRCADDTEIVIQAAMEYCRRRHDLKFERALRKRLKKIGAYRFGDLCEKVITTEQEPNDRSNAIIGVLDKAVKAQETAEAKADKAAQEIEGADIEPNEVGA